VAPKKVYTGINIQFPISELIISGKKKIETRTYPVPDKYLGQEMLLIETPGINGEFKSRIRAVIVFSSCFEYKDKAEFYKDVNKHCVTFDSAWAWDDSKGKWGWNVEVKEVFNSPLPLKKRTGIIYSINLSIERK
jgi:hypothetical protein